MDTVLPGLVERLQPLRIKKGLMQKEMASLLNVTEGHYQKMEYGKINLSATTLIFLADYFQVSIDYLLGRE